MKAYRSYVQGYNAQTVTTTNQIIVAAEIAPDGLDFARLDPMVQAAERELAQAGVKERPGVVLADAATRRRTPRAPVKSSPQKDTGVFLLCGFRPSATALNAPIASAAIANTAKSPSRCSSCSPSAQPTGWK